MRFQKQSFMDCYRFPNKANSLCREYDFPEGFRQDVLRSCFYSATLRIKLGAVPSVNRNVRGNGDGSVGIADEHFAKRDSFRLARGQRRVSSNRIVDQAKRPLCAGSSPSGVSNSCMREGDPAQPSLVACWKTGFAMLSMRGARSGRRAYKLSRPCQCQTIATTGFGSRAPNMASALAQPWR
jgi:hypothetical protein